MSKKISARLSKLILLALVFSYSHSAGAISEDLANRKFGTPHLAVLDQKAAVLLERAQGCVGSQQIRDWYFRASKTCPTLRNDLHDFQQSVFSYLVTSKIEIAPLASAAKIGRSAQLDSQTQAMKDEAFNQRASLLTNRMLKQDNRDEYYSQIFGTEVVDLNPLLAQEIFRIYALIFQDGNWSPQFFYTMYCEIDPLMTCPTRIMGSDENMRLAATPLQTNAQDTYVRIFVNAAYLLSHIPYDEARFLDSAEVVRYHFGASYYGVVPYDLQSASSKVLTPETQEWHRVAEDYVMGPNSLGHRNRDLNRNFWAMDWNLAEVALGQFMGRYSYYNGKIRPQPDRPLHSNEVSKWLAPILRRASDAGVSPWPTYKIQNECLQTRKSRCFKKIPDVTF